MNLNVDTQNSTMGYDEREDEGSISQVLAVCIPVKIS